MPRSKSSKQAEPVTGYWKHRPIADAGDVLQADMLRFQKRQGIVLGWGIVCTEFGKAYVDTQGDHIPDEAMFEAAVDFMLNSRVSGDMHQKADGQVVFAFPLTAEIAKAYGITCDRTGLMVAIKPSAEVLAKFESGEYTGFSIGGAYIDNEKVEAA